MGSKTTLWRRAPGALCAALLAALLCASAAAENGKPFTVPELTSWAGGEGVLTPSGRVVVADKSLEAAARAFCADYALVAGRSMALSARDRPRAGDIVLTLAADARLADEGYRMTIGERVDIAAPTPRAAGWALQTLLQMCEGGKPLPRGEAEDVPQYRFRGFMLDVGRKFVPMDYLRKLTRVMAYYKMNTLQLHLNDNAFPQFFEGDWDKTPAAFRLESETFPGLAAADGHYTKAEFRDLVRYAAGMGVEIVPEIDSPGHSLAFTRHRPSLASGQYGADHLDIFKPEVYEFMDSLFAEYLGGDDPVFAGPHVHIGTDEFSNATQELVEKFRAYTDHYLGVVLSYGKRPFMWGALTWAKGETPIRQDGVTMFAWSPDRNDPRVMKEQGWNWISIPDRQTYIVPLADYYHDRLPIEPIYASWTPNVLWNTRFDDRDPQILGGMFALWNDIYGNGVTVPDLHDRIFPVLQTFATKCWTAHLTSFAFGEFDKGRRQLREAPGVNVAGRLPAGGVAKASVAPGEPLGLAVDEAGFGCYVSFRVDCRPEALGTVLAEGPTSTFYLRDPVGGRLGYAREGYLDSFAYTLPDEGVVEIGILTASDGATLFVDGRRVERLGEQRFYVVPPGGGFDKMPGAAMRPAVWRATASMRYQRSLHFPLRRAGRFKSVVSDLKVVCREAAGL